ncbi:MAG: Reverse transcriptase (RNA-dependent DNA polymerase) [Bacteroidales bacterium]|nr:Reverse transcriptase (RNA-dependent DNA polymerase) [Bacteroidales bacterium]
MGYIVNTKHDTTTYECCSYQREIFNIELLYESYQKSKIGSDWKPQVQRFEMNLLTELTKLHKELKNRTFNFSPPNQFVLNERGKTRVISGDHIRDRVVKRALCDEILMPSIKKYLIHDNGASLKGKGTGFTRRRLEIHLRRFYMKNKSNSGYILLGDYSKFFDNIRHDLLMDMLKKIVHDKYALWLVEKVLDQARIDVSYMSDKEFKNSLNTVFNSLDYAKIDKSLLTGEKFMAKHMNIGDQVAQVAGIFYPHRLDNFIKIVEGEKFYGRYMDDYYVIHESKDRLIELQDKIKQQAFKNGIFINDRKVYICKLSELWRYLKIQYSLTSTGRIIKKVHPKNITRMRRRLKKLAKTMNEKEFRDYYRSWFLNHYKIMSRKQRDNMDELYHSLREVYFSKSKEGLDV